MKGDILTLKNTPNSPFAFHKEFVLPLTKQDIIEIFCNFAKVEEARDFIARVETYEDMDWRGPLPHSFDVRPDTKWRKKLRES